MPKKKKQKILSDEKIVNLIKNKLVEKINDGDIKAIEIYIDVILKTGNFDLESIQKYNNNGEINQNAIPSIVWVDSSSMNGNKDNE